MTTENIIIESMDFYGDECLVDKFANKSDSLRRPRGNVNIYEEINGEKNLLVDKKNLIVFVGREMLAQRLVNLNNSFLSTPTKDEFVTWFGLGDGGVRTADPLDPIPPINNDNGLYSPIPISDSSGAVYANFHNANDPYPPGGVYPFNGSYAKSFDSVVFEPDVLNDSKQLIIKITTTIGSEDANGYQLSEAGLFSAESNVGGYAGNFTLFARITFPSLIKTIDRRLIFVWYLYV